MNENLNKNAEVEQLTKLFLSREEEKYLIVKDSSYFYILVYPFSFLCLMQTNALNMIKSFNVE